MCVFLVCIPVPVKIHQISRTRMPRFRENILLSRYFKLHVFFKTCTDKKRQVANKKGTNSIFCKVGCNDFRNNNYNNLTCLHFVLSFQQKTYKCDGDTIYNNCLPQVFVVPVKTFKIRQNVLFF